jgi:hypothetical protein
MTREEPTWFRAYLRSEGGGMELRDGTWGIWPYFHASRDLICFRLRIPPTPDENHDHGLFRLEND